MEPGANAVSAEPAPDGVEALLRHERRNLDIVEKTSQELIDRGLSLTPLEEKLLVAREEPFGAFAWWARSHVVQKWPNRPLPSENILSSVI